MKPIEIITVWWPKPKRHIKSWKYGENKVYRFDYRYTGDIKDLLIKLSKKKWLNKTDTITEALKLMRKSSES